MRRFEYHTQVLSVQGTEAPKRNQKYLTQMGNDGWEVVNTYNKMDKYQHSAQGWGYGYAVSMTITFKRRKPNFITRFLNNLRK